jgi:hypothetical protein
MTLRFLKPDMGLCEIEAKLKDWFQNTKFVIHEIYRRSYSGRGRFKGGDITLLRIRLRNSCFYYGYGPTMNELPMRSSGWVRGDYRPFKVSFLAGNDWIEFNDTLNDFMDHHQLSADVGTKHCVVRRGAKRRIVYDASMQKVHGRTDRVFWWERVPQSNLEEGSIGFIEGSGCPLLPFSTCNASPGGFYKMFNNSFEPPPP